MDSVDRPTGFLSDFQRRAVELEGAQDFEVEGLILGEGPGALEVVVVRAARQPSMTLLRNVWKRRQGRRGVPLLIVALYDERAALCGAAGEEPPVYTDVDSSVVERVCATALRQPSRHAALRFLYSVLPQINTALPGIRNEGFLTLHELEYGVSQRQDFAEATAQAGSALGKRKLELLDSLGFTHERQDDYTYLLLAPDHHRAVAVLLLPDEAPDTASGRFSGLSPVSYALSIAERENVPYVLLLNDTSVRLHPVKDGVGVAQRGRVDTFLELNLDLLPADSAGYLWLLCSADALAEGGSFEEILERARDRATHIGTRLRERVYQDVIPKLAMAIWEARGIREPTSDDLAETYEMALSLLFRLLFIAYAEDKELLPYRTNDAYRRRSLKQKAHELHKIQHERTPISAGASYWVEIRTLWHAIDEGRSEWGVPQYNGHLFSRDAFVSPVGAKLEDVTLTNDVFVPILTHLLIDRDPVEGIVGPVDFSALGVREFGTIYEGLLENEISIADTDLTVKKRKNEEVYWPVADAAKGTPVVVRQGDAYLRTASGTRKATGSYYTKDFAVQHLLDHALEPALNNHLERLDGLDDDEAAEAFFDFRVADIAMGSGHFLVAAVDRIERRLSQYLSEHPLPGVREELGRLRAAAQEALGPAREAVAIEDSQLLRRQIARRCIYGVDINPLAVQLARVSLWIHTFVPGLPLSFLDHNLVEGNSLVGIATIEEAREELDKYAPNLFAATAEELLGAAREPLERLAHITDADAREIAAARRALDEAQEAIKPTRALFDILTAARVDEELSKNLQTGGGKADVLGKWMDEPQHILGSEEWRDALRAMADLQPFHFPTAFPEVFLRGDGNGGFDCILGNPPWKKTHVEEHEFWCRHRPGMKGLPQHAREREIAELRKERPDLADKLRREISAAESLRRALIRGHFPGISRAHADLYKAFSWRFWHLLQSDGMIGVVLPRAAFCSAGGSDFRLEVLSVGTVEDLTFLLNKGGWVFDDAEHRMTVSLTTLSRMAPCRDSCVRLRGPFASLAEFDAGVAQEATQFVTSDVLSWSDTAALPLFPAHNSGAVFAQLRRAPRLDSRRPGSWRVRAIQGDLDLNPDRGKALMDVSSEECPPGFWPVYKGESFRLWQPDTGVYYAFADPGRALPYLQAKRLRSAARRGSHWSEFELNWVKDEDTLPCLRPRIAVRRSARWNDSRTAIVALVPPNVFVVDAGVLLWPSGTVFDEAYLLGVLCSIPLDWYARRFVENHLDFHILEPFPIPRTGSGDALCRRVVCLAGRLAAPDERFAEWAEKIGVECGPLGDLEKEDMIAELDAVVAHLYGLTKRQLTHIFETFHEGWDYHQRLRAVLKHYQAWEKRL